MKNIDQRKILSALCHGSVFFSSLVVSIGIPIVVLLVNEDPVVQENAKESLNFHINLYVWAIFFALLIFMLIGIPLLFLLGIASFVMPIIAIMKVFHNPQRPYYYPFIIRLV
jgi:uncharacterized Tic20 family protein